MHLPADTGLPLIWLVLCGKYMGVSTIIRRNEYYISLRSQVSPCPQRSDQRSMFQQSDLSFWQTSTNNITDEQLCHYLVFSSKKR